MAITGTYNYNGIDIVGAIGQVNFIQLRNPKDQTEVTFNTSIFVNEAQFEANNNIALNTYGFHLDLAASDIWAQCYDFLLTLPEFSGWTQYNPPIPDPV